MSRSLLHSLTLLSLACHTASAALNLRLISFNIRYATTSLFDNERPWQERAPLVINQLQHEVWPVASSVTDNSTSTSTTTTKSYTSAFICLQEVLHAQLIDILAGLNNVPSNTSNVPTSGPKWAHIGVGRDDGKTKGEYSPIIYPIGNFDLLHAETVWLSPTPDKPSKGWDAGSIRILTIGVFRHKATQQTIIATNTHLDNAGTKSRLESVGIILDRLQRAQKQWSTGNGTSSVPMFLTGDFNSLTTQEAYQAMVASGYMRDLRDQVDAKSWYGNVNTFTGFVNAKEDQKRIDYIWLGPKEEKRWTVAGYAVLPNVFDGGVYLSDHRAVVGDVVLS
ncbi:endonuclease/exonuclease/phosphatase family protein [Cercophora scortea]|uniref:Endonuclease/exonuclease/phosphatase family protein n=1 Tax=Cercophora scortea TaxID=314031 RepID=A0AAE0IFF4_9PEZI|nr:endonuclease/exonuclease/phosphatase family protein [Cercophora scortea]